MAMLRRLGLILAPLAISIVLTMVISTKMMASDNNGNSLSLNNYYGKNNARLDSEVDYLMGEAPPPPPPPPMKIAIKGVGLRQPKRQQQQQRQDEPINEIVSEGEEDEKIVVDGEEEEKADMEEEEEDDDYDADYDHDSRRPRKHPKGKRWMGWPKEPHKEATLLSNNSGSGNEYEWWRDSNKCFEVDYICHGRDKNKWLYYAPYHTYDTNNNKVTMFQPTMELKAAPAKYDGGKDVGEKRISIKVDASSKIKREDVTYFKDGQEFIQNDDGGGGGNYGSVDAKCHISPSPTHIVLQSLFNDMIGEFYSRTLLRLHNILTRAADEKNSENNDNDNDNDTGDSSGNGKLLLPWEKDIQFYVHIPYGNKKMLDGHKLLLSGMLSNPDSPYAESLVDLFEKRTEEDTAEEDVEDGGSSDDCMCYEKMVFCGYDIYTHPADVKSRDLETAKDDDKNNGDDDDDNSGVDDDEQQNGQSDDTNDEINSVMSPTATFDYDTKYTLWSAAKLDAGTALDTGSCGRGTGKSGTEYECQDWNNLRSFLLTTFVKHYPTLEEDIVHRRRAQLLQKGVIDESYEGDTKEFTVVGLTQRTYRRAWINLPEIMEDCNAAASFERTICVEVNVEKTFTPLEQLLLHRSLDVMIGVHGAQLTQAILLPKHAHVLELLPWIPDYIRGKWVQTTHGPTPLGIIFHNTDLNHVGYSLDRSSVPLCEGVSEEELQKCFLKNRKKFIWENRDFTVDSKVVLQYIEKFVLFGRDKQRSCEELKGSLDERFVSYNIWCQKRRHWYPTLLDGEKACVYGTNYPIDHTNEFKSNMYLFASRKDCCAQYPDACEADTESISQEKKESSGTVYSLFHNYHEISNKKLVEDLRLPEKKKDNRRKNERRRKQEER